MKANFWMTVFLQFVCASIGCLKIAVFPFTAKSFIAKMVTRYHTLNFRRIKQWLMHGSGQFEEMLGPIFRSWKTAVSAQDTLKTVITKQPLLERENLIMTPFRQYYHGRKPRPRSKSYLICIYQQRVCKTPKKEIQERTTNENRTWDSERQY